MKKNILGLLILTSCSILAQNNPLKKYEALRQKYQFSSLLEKIKPTNQKTNQFFQAYTYFEYDTLNNQWVPYDRTTEWIETFASQPSKINVGVKVESFQTGSWQNADSIVFIGDTAIDRFKIPDDVGLVDTLKLYLWNDSLMDWELQIFEHLTFSANQLQEYNGFVASSYLGLPGNTFINLSKTTYAYHTTGQIEYFIKSGYSFVSATLQKQDSIRVQVDQNGFPRELTNYKVDIVPPSLFSKELFVNDRFGNKVDEKDLSYDNLTSSFDTTYRYRYVFDQNRNLLSDTTYSYQNNIAIRDRYGVSTYQQNYIQDYKAYYYNNGVPSLRYETDYFYTIPSQVDSLIYYDIDQAGNRQFNGKEIYQYAPFTTDLKKIGKFESNHLSFYPNPATQVIRFEKALTSPVHIIDISGKRIETIPSNAKEYRLSHLDNGLYFLRTDFGTQKLLKY